MANRFDRNVYPRVPHGAMHKGGNTVFHRRARFWKEAVAVIKEFETVSGIEFNQEKRPEANQSVDLWDKAIAAIQKFEAHCDAMNAWYGMLNEAGRVADTAMKEAGLTFASEEGRRLYLEVEKKYTIEHPVEFPQ